MQCFTAGHQHVDLELVDAEILVQAPDAVATITEAHDDFIRLYFGIYFGFWRFG